MNQICDYQECTACQACKLSCSQDAISMREDDFGYLLPYIDQNKCINCGRCLTVCHINNEIEKHKIKRCYAGVSVDESIYKRSSSGGFSTVLSEYVIKNSGIVYGAAFDDKHHLKHIRISNLSELSKIQGSKYTESFLGDTFENVKRDIKNTLTLFIGAPCQVAGLLTFLSGLNVDNLVTVSFICGGVVSNKFLRNNLGDKMSNLKKIEFRRGAQYAIWLNYKNGVEKCLHREKSLYLIGFIHNLTQRLSCFNCKYSKMDRVGDITVGDFWGLNNGRFVALKHTGVSVIMPTTNRGIKIIAELRPFLDLEEHDMQEAIIHNKRLQKSLTYHYKTAIFRQLYKWIGFNTAVRIAIGGKYWLWLLKKKFKEVITNRAYAASIIL